MKAHYCLVGISLFLISCTTQDQPKILEVGGNQLPAEPSSNLINKSGGEDPQKLDNNIPASAAPTIDPGAEPTNNFNFQTPYGPGLDALPTLVIPSPSGNKIVILPPPSR